MKYRVRFRVDTSVDGKPVRAGDELVVSEATMRLCKAVAVTVETLRDAAAGSPQGDRNKRKQEE